MDDELERRHRQQQLASSSLSPQANRSRASVASVVSVASVAPVAHHEFHFPQERPHQMHQVARGAHPVEVSCREDRMTSQALLRVSRHQDAARALRERFGDPSPSVSSAQSTPSRWITSPPELSAPFSYSGQMVMAAHEEQLRLYHQHYQRQRQRQLQHSLSMPHYFPSHDDAATFDSTAGVDFRRFEQQSRALPHRPSATATSAASASSSDLRADHLWSPPQPDSSVFASPFPPPPTAHRPQSSLPSSLPSAPLAAHHKPSVAKTAQHSYDLSPEPKYRSPLRRSSEGINDLNIVSGSSNNNKPGKPASPPRGRPSPVSSSSSSVESRVPSAAARAGFPLHFTLGSLIQLASGDLKRVEELAGDDFVRSAEGNRQVELSESVVSAMRADRDRGAVTIVFEVVRHDLVVTVEADLEHPFFVLGQGWSSSTPDRTLLRYGLQCSQLKVGDSCIVLTHRATANTTITTATATAAMQSGPRTSVSEAGLDQVIMPPPSKKRRFTGESHKVSKQVAFSDNVAASTTVATASPIPAVGMSTQRSSPGESRGSPDKSLVAASNNGSAVRSQPEPEPDSEKIGVAQQEPS